MKAEMSQLVECLLDPAVPFVSAQTREDSRLVAIDTVLCARFAGGSVGVGGRDALGIRHWAGSPSAVASAIESNASLAHASELDSVQYVSRGHPGVVILPVLSALVDLGEIEPADGVDLLAVSTEVMACLGQAWGPGLSEAGVHATSVLGPLAVVAAIGAARDMSRGALERSMFAAAALAAGPTSTFGTSLKARQVGRAAALALDLILRPPTDLAGPDWQEEMCRRFGEPQADWITEEPPQLGIDLAVEQVPTMFKLLPACGYFSQALSEVIALRGLPPASEISRLVIDVPKQAAAVNRGTLPRTPDEVPFSLEYLIGCILVAGGLGDFRASFWRSNPAVSDLVGRIQVRPLDGEFAFIDSMISGELTVIAQGRRVEHQIAYSARPAVARADDIEQKWLSIARDHGLDLHGAHIAVSADLTAHRTAAYGHGLFPRYYAEGSGSR